MLPCRSFHWLLFHGTQQSVCCRLEEGKEEREDLTASWSLDWFDSRGAPLHRGTEGGHDESIISSIGHEPAHWRRIGSWELQSLSWTGFLLDSAWVEELIEVAR